MSDERRETAERVVRGWRAYYPDNGHCLEADAPMVADWYLEMLDQQASDAEPLTKGWLKQIGGDYFGEARMCSFTFGGIVGMLWLDLKPITEAEWFIGSGPSRHILPTPRTRGDVRVLFERLQSRLHESELMQQDALKEDVGAK